MTPPDKLAELVQKALALRVNEIVAEEAKLAATNVENRVRSEAAAITARVVTRMSFERFGSELIIKLDFTNTKT